MRPCGMVDRSMETQASKYGEGIVSKEDNGADLFDILFVFWEARRRIALFTLAALVTGAVISLVMAPTYAATALILPPEQGQSTSSMLMNQLGLAALAGGAIKTPADLYLGILASRTISDDIIEKFHLDAVYKTRTPTDTRTRLKSNTRTLATKDGLIHITVEDHDAQRASDLTNAYVDELHGMNSRLAVTEAAQRRIFFDQELVNEKSALTVAEDDLRKTAEKTGVIQLGGQAESIIRSIANVRAQISSEEVQLQSMRTFATDQNPETMRVQQEIAALRSQLAALAKDPHNPQATSTEFQGGQVPEVSLEYARKLREVRYHESLFDLLSKQYEAARIDEAKAAPIIQVIDRAVPPDKRSSPQRTLFTAGFGAIGLFLACLGSLAGRVLRRMEETPEYAPKLARMRDSLPFGSRQSLKSS